MAEVLLDSYSEENQVSLVGLSSSTYGIGQAFTPSETTTISKAVLYMSRTINVVSGSAVASLYAVSGTPGTNAVPTGPALATSDLVDVLEIPSGAGGGKGLVEFPFSSSYILESGTYYIIAVSMETPLEAGYGVTIYTGSSDHQGNGATMNSGGTWSSSSADRIFYIYGNETETNTYYFDGHNGISDPDGVWTDEANAFDGDDDTYASIDNSDAGDEYTNYLQGIGTSSPASGGAITQVRARSCDHLGCFFFETIDPPVGGWTWEAVQNLEVRIWLVGSPAFNPYFAIYESGDAGGTRLYGRAAVSSEFGRIELEVTHEASSDTELTTADLATTPTLETVSLTQAHTISDIGSLSTAPALETITLTQHYTLTVADLSTAPSLGTLALTQAHTLAVDDLSTSPDLEALPYLGEIEYVYDNNEELVTDNDGNPVYVLSDAIALSVAHLTTTPSLEAVALTQQHTLQVDNLSTAPSLTSPTVTVSYTLTVADLATSPALSSPTISVAYSLTVADLTTTTNLETLSLVQQHVISVGNLGTTPTLETLDLILGGALTISDLATAPAFETVSLTPGLSIDGLTASTSLESITLLPDYILSVNDLSTTPVLGTVELVPHYVLSVSHLSTAPSLSEPGVVTVVTLILADLSLLPVFENTNLVQQSILSGVAELIATTHLQETTVSPEVAVANLATSPSLSAIPHLRDDYRLWKFEKPTNPSVYKSEGVLPTTWE